MILNCAHRGASGYYPENTMLAFEKAIEMGCDCIETDIHLTKDGVAVLCHDEKIDRTTDGAGFIRNYTFSELRRFDAGIKYGYEFMGLKIPALEEFLSLVRRHNMEVNLELKNNIYNYENLEKIVIDNLYKYNLQEKVIISSFNHYSIMRCKEIDNSLRLAFLYDNQLYNPWDYGKRAGIYALHPNYRTLNEDVVKNTHNEGIKINAYTVNKEDDMERLINLKVDGIITNFPDKLNRLLK